MIHTTDLDCGEIFAYLPEAVERGLISEAVIDESLARLLTIRFRLGAFDPQERDPYATLPYSVLEADSHKAHALKMAHESMVLLKNNGLLPLRHNLRRIAVLGPNADSPEVQLGNYNGFPSEIVTPLKGIRAKTGAEIVYLRASDYTTPEAGADEIRKAVEGADLVIYVGGISPRLEGEEGDAGREKLDGFLGGDRTGIMLPKVQTQVMQVVKQIGIPLVFVSMSGSAVAFPWEAENADAILQAWYGGQAAGTAVADILWGDCNPSGRLPVTFYADDEQLPDFNDYSMKGRTYRYFEGQPLYPFGYGLSYTTFTYDTPVCTAKTTVTGESVKVVTRVRNTGSVAGDEVVQLYVSHPDAPEPKPIRALKGVKRIHLQPGEEQIVEFTLTPRNLALVNVTALRPAVRDASRSISAAPSPSPKRTGDNTPPRYASKVPAGCWPGRRSETIRLVPFRDQPYFESFVTGRGRKFFLRIFGPRLPLMRPAVLQRREARHLLEFVIEMRDVAEPRFISHLYDAEIGIDEQFVCEVNTDFQQAVENTASGRLLEIPT